MAKFVLGREALQLRELVRLCCLIARDLFRVLIFVRIYDSC